MLGKIKLENFTVFEKLEIDFSPGINIFVGENGTGKTHIIKALYSACDISKSQKSLAEKIFRVFLPSKNRIGRLVRRTPSSSKGYIEVWRKSPKNEIRIRLKLSSHTQAPEQASESGNTRQWREHPIESVYIPVKDMMANAPGFRSLYSLRDIHFEEVYADIIDRAFLGTLKGPVDAQRKKLLAILQKSMDGKVITKNEEFFLKNKQGELEFTLLAEGVRKLALLWVLIQNGSLTNGSVLFWDEPEANLNPKLMGTVVEILIELQRMGVQIFLTTHDYVTLKEFDLQATDQDKLLFHSLYWGVESRKIEIASTDTYLDIAPNAIDDTFGDIVDREISKTMGSLGK